MRGICLVIALLGVPVIAASQPRVHVSAGAAPASSSAGTTSSTGSFGAIGLPLPSIGLPLPSIGLSPRAPIDDPRNSGHRDNGRDDRQRGGERRDGEWRDGGYWRGNVNPFGHQRSPRPGFIYVGPQYPYVGPHYPYAGMVTTTGVVAQTTLPGVITVVEPATGRLVLEVEPADILQVFVDGEFVGTPADLGNALDLQPGTRRIEFRAPGHKTLTIDAQIVSQRTIVYRATLERLVPTRTVPAPAAPIAPPSPEPAPVSTANRTMYLIPGCYMGNVPPQDLKLPAGCDLSRLTTIKP